MDANLDMQGLIALLNVQLIARSHTGIFHTRAIIFPDIVCMVASQVLLVQNVLILVLSIACFQRKTGLKHATIQQVNVYTGARKVMRDQIVPLNVQKLVL